MKTILIVDDEKNARTVLADILRASHYHVLEAENGQEALAILHRQPVDLLLTDRTMPQLDGLELLRQLRAENNPLPVIMISGFGEERLWAEAIGLGAQDYLLKPFSPEDVLKAVKKYLKALP